MENYRLWENGAPLFDASVGQEEPNIDVWLADPSNGRTSAVVVCPGGGYCGRAEDHEGVAICQMYNSIGISAFMLRYRVTPYNYPVELYDVQRAIRFVRANADKFNILEDRIGVMGFSAGGHLAMMATEFFDEGLESGDSVDKVSSRPDLAILCYPVVTLEGDWLHYGSAVCLLSDMSDGELRHKLSGEHSVPDNCPPVFLWHTSDDDVVDVKNSLEFCLALHAKNVPFEYHVFPHGAHGMGIASEDPSVGQWSGLLHRWLKYNNF